MEGNTNLKSNNLIYKTDSSFESNTDTTTYKMKIKFFVDGTGTVGKVKMISCDNCTKKVKKDFGGHAMNIIKKLPKWESSGKYPNGVWYILPVTFKLTDTDSITVKTP
jgi:hypothetical protein